MVDLTTSYLGLELSNPLVASASVLSKKIDNIKKLEDSNISAIVLYSLFEEQLTNESLALNYFLEKGTESFSEALTYFPDLESYNVGPDKYFKYIQKAKEAVNIPIIGSLNGVSKSSWISYAKMIEEAGADALELNIYYLSTNKEISASALENAYLDLVTEMNGQIDIPLAVKLSPFFTSLPNFASHLVNAGVKGLVLFNRFYQPNLDIDSLEVIPSLELSTSSDLLLPLRWIAILNDRIKVDFALTSGVHHGKDIIKSMMAGAKVSMTASELIANGIPRATEMLDEVSSWMQLHEYTSIKQMQGSMSQKAIKDPASYERANYMKALTLFDNEFLY